VYGHLVFLIPFVDGAALLRQPESKFKEDVSNFSLGCLLPYRRTNIIDICFLMNTEGTQKRGICRMPACVQDRILKT
jgi:hypothetical protein